MIAALCAIHGCRKLAQRREWCRSHYEIMLRSGEIEKQKAYYRVHEATTRNPADDPKWEPQVDGEFRRREREKIAAICARVDRIEAEQGKRGDEGPTREALEAIGMESEDEGEKVGRLRLAQSVWCERCDRKFAQAQRNRAIGAQMPVRAEMTEAEKERRRGIMLRQAKQETAK
jgi:hypothetical protein